eukprot:NODE_832_length_3620_cov_0.696677.p3 type:complete len:233 gc:universal NODE_832_length_3620_cov_0.696677:750-52(-)
MNLIDIIHSMFFEAEREDDTLTISVTENIKLVVNFCSKELVFDVLSTKNFKNIKELRNLVDESLESSIVEFCEQEDYAAEAIEKAIDIILNWKVIPNESTSNIGNPVHSTASIIPVFKSSDKFVVSKSSFVAHVCHIESIGQLNNFIGHLKLTLSDATHHILAYNVGKFYDYDDDGEDGAGHRLLFMLRQNKLTNIAVVVSRWFGGIKLGPARFKIITNIARDLLKKENILD